MRTRRQSERLSRGEVSLEEVADEDEEVSEEEEPAEDEEVSDEEETDERRMVARGRGQRGNGEEDEEEDEDEDEVTARRVRRVTKTSDPQKPERPTAAPPRETSHLLHELATSPRDHGLLPASGRLCSLIPGFGVPASGGEDWECKSLPAPSMVLARAGTLSARPNGARSPSRGGVPATVIRLVVRSTVWSLASRAT
jgi:hypothetical protein